MAFLIMAVMTSVVYVMMVSPGNETHGLVHTKHSSINYMPSQA